MAFIGTEERILREEDDQGAEADPTRWGGICFAHVKFSSIYPDNAMRGALVFVAEFALSVRLVGRYDTVPGDHT